MDAWQDFAGYAGPKIQHHRLENLESVKCDHARGFGGTLFTDVHTVGIGDALCTLRPWFCIPFPGILDGLKEHWSQLKTICFKVPKKGGVSKEPESESEPDCPSGDCDPRGEGLFDQIEDLVAYRFKQGRPFSSVERMVTGESEGVDGGDMETILRRSPSGWLHSSTRRGAVVLEPGGAVFVLW